MESGFASSHDCAEVASPPGSERAARLEQLLAERKRELRLPETLEASFRVHFLEEGVGKLRLGMVATLFLFGVFALWDLMSFPTEVLVPSLLLRILVAMPALAMVLFATYRPWSTGTLDLLRLVMAFAVGFTVVAITAIARAKGVPAAPHGLFLVTVGAYTITGMRTPQALVAGASVFCMQIAADLVAGRSVPEMVEPVVFILSANVIGCAAALSHERAARTSFLRLKLLECRADQDGLTGIPNRRAFDRAAERAFQSAAREKTGVVVAIFDVDLFKDYNDRLGHMAGDACLQRIARAAEGLAQRPMDIAARIGGDEFAVLWYDASPEGASALANRIHRAAGGPGSERPDRGPCRRVTVSVGAVHVDPRGATPLAAMAEADEALYEAKGAGRDRVEVRNLEGE